MSLGTLAGGEAWAEQTRTTTTAAPALLFSYKLGKGVALEDPGHRFKLNIKTRLQVRYTGESGDEGAKSQHGVAIRRARLDVGGYIASPSIRYRMQLAFSPADVGLTDAGAQRRVPVLDGYIELKAAQALWVRAGQGKVPFNLERLASSQESRMVDRSLVDGEFTLDRDVGVTVFSDAPTDCGCFGYAAGVYAGEGHSPLGLADPEFLYLGRVEVRPFGKMNHRVFTDFERRSAPALGLGGAVGYLQGAHFQHGNRSGEFEDGVTEDHMYWAADALFLWQGLSAQVEAVGRRVLGDAVDRDGFGVYGEVGYLFAALPVAAAGHVGVLVPGADDSALSKRREAGVGFQYFLGAEDAHPTSTALRLGADYFQRWVAGEAHVHQVRVQLEATL